MKTENEDCPKSEDQSSKEEVVKQDLEDGSSEKKPVAPQMNPAPLQINPALGFLDKVEIDWPGGEGFGKGFPASYGNVFPGFPYPGAGSVDEEGGNKTYVCHLCDFRTAYSNSLMNHQAVHSDVRPWVCQVCQYAAKRKQDLKKHLHTIHGLMVESTMLKPIHVNTGLFDGAENNDGSSDESRGWKKSPPRQENDSSFSLTPGPATGMDLTVTDVQAKQKAEHQDKPLDGPEIPGSPSAQGLPSMSNFVHGPSMPPDLSEEADDDYLPVTFQPVGPEPDFSDSKLEPRLPSQPLLPPAFPHGGNPRAQPLVSGKSATPQRAYSLPMLADKRDPSFRPSTSFEFPSFPGKQPSKSSRSDSKRSAPLDADASSYPEDEVQRTWKRRALEVDKTITSSSMVSHARWTQTAQHFLCEHCDIMFFQRAMYVMHMALHSKENPWCCSVCGGVFTEKYSFTSHFINQH